MKKLYKLLIVLLGSFLTGAGVPVMLSSNLGADTLSCMIQGGVNHLGITFGTLSILFNVFLLIIVLVVDRSRIGVGSILSIVTIGVTVDAITPLFPDLSGLGLPLRFVLMLVGVVLIGIGVGSYAAADFGTAPLDALVLILTHKTKLPLGVVRMFFDVTMTVLGFLLGGPVGVGTVVTVLLLGPIMNLFFRVTEKILKRIPE